MTTRVRDWWQRPPKRFSESVFLNVLGYQVLRVLWLNLLRAGFVGAGSDTKAIAEKLIKQGAIVLPNFLPDEVFKEIRAAYEKAIVSIPEKPLAYPYIVKKTNKTRVSLKHLEPEPGSHLYSLLRTHILESSLLKKLGATVVRRRIGTFRDPQVFWNKKVSDEYPDLNTDIYYHADAPYPGFKAFYYLSDTDEANGAFRYMLESHHLTLKRLWWEYRKSIEWAWQMRVSQAPGDETGRAWHCLTRVEEECEGIRGTSMVGKANSLLVFNVMGFHRRGEFTSDRPREFAVAYYRV